MEFTKSKNFSLSEKQAKKAPVSLTRDDLELAILSYLDFCRKKHVLKVGDGIKIELGTSKQGTFHAFRAVVTSGKTTRKLSKIIVFSANAYKSRGRGAEFGKVLETLDLGTVAK